MRHLFDRYDYLIQIGRHLGIKIESIRDLRFHLSQIPEFNTRTDLRKLDNLKRILDYLEKKSSNPELQSANGKYQGILGLQMEGGSKKSAYALTPYLVLYLQIKDQKLDGAWITLSSKRLKFPIYLKELNQEFDFLIRSIEDPRYEDEII